jgi:Ser/Thr protein kinase RdoA (MazF antagonist)
LLTTIALEHETVACSLLRWVAGDPFPQIPSPQQAAQLGRLLAALHLQARAWSPPQSFVRPRYDVAFYKRQMEGCVQVVQEGLLQQPEWTLLRRTLEQVFRELSAQPVSLQLIHADLHRGNLLVAGSQVCAIDFAFCGWGSPLFDVGTALLGLPSALRVVALQAYQERIPFSADASRLLDAYALLSRMGAYLFLLAEPAERTWLRERLPRFVAQDCQRFLQSEPILLDELSP